MVHAFRSKAQVENIFRDFWKLLFQQTSVKEDLVKLRLSILVLIDRPEVAMYVDEDGVSFKKDALSKTALVTMKMSGDTAHSLWTGSLNMANAMAEMQIKATGPVNKVLALIELLKAHKGIYASCCEKYGVTK